MPLPVLSQHALASPADLLRYFQRTERLWTAHLGETEQLDVGVAVTSPELPDVHDANRMLEANLPPGIPPEQAIAEVEQHFRERQVRCRAWQMAVGETPGEAPEGRGLQSYLERSGLHRTVVSVMSLHAGTAGVPNAKAASPSPGGSRGLTILPARAAFRQARVLAEEELAGYPSNVVEARMLHLDDPHCDALLALRDGRAVGRVTVFAGGDVGRIEQVYVAGTDRRQGIGRLLMMRALEICARSLFRHVLLSVDPANVAAVALYENFGFRRIGEIVTWRGDT